MQAGQKQPCVADAPTLVLIAGSSAVDAANGCCCCCGRQLLLLLQPVHPTNMLCLLVSGSPQQQQHDTFGLQHANDELDAATATLWFAGKQLLPKNQLSHHLGRHEKTKAVIKLQQAGQGAPAREAV